ncbi:sporulation protein [Streptomyces sp. NRRL F-5630]|uniref:sporulation protein n=1 Tax=Streptomyces sp. NRRL F-5630 TaxID=1463864 RepID=UPI003D738CB6
MVFKRLLGALGAGGPSVDTVLAEGPVLPGGTLTGEVRLGGGEARARVEDITLELLARVEAESEEDEHEGVVVFERHHVGGDFTLEAGEERVLPFALAVPWETPTTELYGQSLGIVLGVRTEVALGGARDKGDLDPLVVSALPVQEAVLDAFGRLGWGFRSADLELGRIGGTGQRLPFYQEIELTPPPALAHAVNEVEVTFLASATGADVVLEADKRGGLLGGGHDALTRFTVAHADVPALDWASEVDGWITHLLEHSSAYGDHGSYYSHADPYGGGHTDHHDHTDHHESHGAGHAVLAGAAGLAVGAAGGLVAAEVIDEAGDWFEGDEGSEDGDEE